jgi:hypothetical protein
LHLQRIYSDFVRQLGGCLDGLDRLRLSEDAFLDKHMNEALAEHQGDFAVGLRGSHN